MPTPIPVDNRLTSTNMETDFTPLTSGADGEKTKKKKNKMKKNNKTGLSRDPFLVKDTKKDEKKKKLASNSTTLHSEIPDPVKDNPQPSAASLQKYDRGEKGKKFLRDAKKRRRNEKKTEKAKEDAVRAELLLLEPAGFVEERAKDEDEAQDDEDDDLGFLTQDDIKRSVDITSASKIFDLHLDKLGPYRHRFTRNGRHLVLGGANGHLATLDWQTKRLSCELSVNETVHDVTFLHNETMFAAAQKAYTCIYDNKGVELHCLRRIDHAVHLEFLPYHFLLAAGNSHGYLKYLDVSVGKFIGGVHTGGGNLKTMTQNPKNGVIFVGNPQGGQFLENRGCLSAASSLISHYIFLSTNFSLLAQSHPPPIGTVTLWSPSSSKYLASLLTNRSAVKSLSVTSCGNYFAAGSVDRIVSVWDIRAMKELRNFR